MQTATAIITGRVQDAAPSTISESTVAVLNDATNVRYSTETNDEGVYSVPDLPPGTYHIQISKQGFKTVVHPDITLNVQDAKAIGFTLPVGPNSDTVTVEGGAPLIDSESAAVSTVGDRQFAENLPMNGRSFQGLIDLAPGVLVTPSNVADAGQLTLNGQRCASNYRAVDGVPVNFGPKTRLSPRMGTTMKESTASNQAGHSIAEVREFRTKTSIFTPESRDIPDRKAVIRTLSGTSHCHGVVARYFPNGVLNAKHWFTNRRQNDFGGVSGVPIQPNKTFFFTASKDFA